jgi:hypothetical protein
MPFLTLLNAIPKHLFLDFDQCAECLQIIMHKGYEHGGCIGSILCGWDNITGYQVKK